MEKLKLCDNVLISLYVPLVLFINIVVEYVPRKDKTIHKGSWKTFLRYLQGIAFELYCGNRNVQDKVE